MPGFIRFSLPASLCKGAIAPGSFVRDLAAAAGVKLIFGDHHGDDYLVLPDEESEQNAIKELLGGSNRYWEAVEALPHHLRYHIA
ncbi:MULTISPECIES: hypothetical protein [unclassified Variovorax]|uniref:hypothetical protein n=1 Tax=unclassified Variovorax TaxID=663243 RepID=UPI0013160E57|nr:MULTISPECIES: hypothetical protein [unclassified Variovorax]VTU43097.1 hypothetical protein SRS16P1_00437 [Variovorax sp. SRS16]VTU43130.1 hypothetical protein E5P1_00434 [Variovorax sp. PBL-E5]VTU43449.1 hypothetical protein H6P1_00469 [Variovorax sp. PBL-H6]